MEFRDATLQDLQVIVDIYNTTVAGRMVTADTEPVTVASREKWFHDHSSKRRPLWIVMDGDATVGWVSFQSFYGRPAYDGTAEVSIYLDPSARGKGLGKKILEHCLNTCPDYKIDTLLGYIFAHNEPSLRLFRRAGFHEWGRLPDIALLDGVRRSVVIVGKRIDQIK